MHVDAIPGHRSVFSVQDLDGVHDRLPQVSREVFAVATCGHLFSVRGLGIPLGNVFLPELLGMYAQISYFFAEHRTGLNDFAVCFSISPMFLALILVF